MARLAEKRCRLRNGPWTGCQKGPRTARSAAGGSTALPSARRVDRRGRRVETRNGPAPPHGPARPLRALGSAESLGRRLRRGCGTAMAPLRDCKVRVGRKRAAQRRSRAEGSFRGRRLPGGCARCARGSRSCRESGRRGRAGLCFGHRRDVGPGKEPAAGSCGGCGWEGRGVPALLSCGLVRGRPERRCLGSFARPGARTAG